MDTSYTILVPPKTNLTNHVFLHNKLSYLIISKTSIKPVITLKSKFTVFQEPAFWGVPAFCGALTCNF